MIGDASVSPILSGDPVKHCLRCGVLLVRGDRSRADFATKKYCSRSCNTSAQNVVRGGSKVQQRKAPKFTPSGRPKKPIHRHIATRADELAAIAEAEQAGLVRRCPDSRAMAHADLSVPFFETTGEALTWLRERGFKAKKFGPAQVQLEGRDPIKNWELRSHMVALVRERALKEANQC